MLRDRILVAVFLIPIFAWIIATGGWAFSLSITIILALAAWEYGLLIRKAGLEPSPTLLALSVIALCAIRYLGGFQDSALVLAGISLGLITWHLVRYERGAERSGSDFAISLGSVVYLGWIGSYLISLRLLQDGEWWFLVALPAVWLADSAAYLFGNWLGKHPLSPRLSPKKTWEGYIAGVVSGGLAGMGFAALWRLPAGSASSLDPLPGLVTGVVIAVFAPLGDLGISMIKRETKVKDTGNLLPGHGGILDRIDSWIWAGVIGYYMIYWLTK